MKRDSFLGVVLPESVAAIVDAARANNKQVRLLNNPAALQAASLPEEQTSATATVPLCDRQADTCRPVDEAQVVRTQQGIFNVRMLQQSQMKRPDNPNAILVADEQPTAKAKLLEVYGARYDEVRRISQDWLAEQDLVLVPIAAGHRQDSIDTLLVVPAQYVVFGLLLSLIQELVPDENLQEFRPQAVIFLCPQLRESLLEGNPYVIHHRGEEVYECYGTGLYPGLNGKKFLYALFMHHDIKSTRGGTPAFTFHASACECDGGGQGLNAGSQGGKTEYNLPSLRNADGSIVIAWQDDECIGACEQVQISGMPADLTLRFHTDDMLHVTNGIARNREAGLFDRTDDFMADSDQPTRWPMFYQELLGGSRGPVAALNYATDAGQALKLGDHLHGIKNGRLFYANTAFDNPCLDDMPLRALTYSVRALRCTKAQPSAGVIPLLMKLSPWEYFLVCLAGLQSAKSASIEGEGLGAAGGIRAAGIGTQFDFTADDLPSLCTSLYSTLEDLDARGCDFYLTAVGASGAFTVRHQFLRMSRELIAHWRRNSPEISVPKWVTPKFAPFGSVLESLHIDGQELDQRLLEVGHCPLVGTDAAQTGWDIICSVMSDELRQYLQMPIPESAKRLIEEFIDSRPRTPCLDRAESHRAATL